MCWASTAFCVFGLEMSRAPASVPSRSFPCAWVIILQFVKHEIWQRVAVVFQEASR